jgi:hypothetical protein
MTLDELRDKLNSAANLLDVLKAFIPGSADDRVVAYVRAVAASDPLLQLVAEDLEKIGLATVPEQLRLTSVDPASGQVVEQAIGDGTILRLLLELLPLILEILKNFPAVRA